MRAAVTPSPGAALLRARALVVGRGAVRVGPLDFSVGQREVLWLSAPAGGSKSLAMRALLGLEQITAGEVELLGVDVAGADARALLALRRRVGYVPQEGALLSNLNLAANLALLAEHHLGLQGEALEARLAEVSDVLALPALAGRGVGDADPSLLRRVAIGRVLALRPEILLLDEPSWAIDLGRSGAFWATLVAARKRLGVALVVASAFPSRRFVDDMSIIELVHTFAERRRDREPA